jgi:hypothetical protein
LAGKFSTRAPGGGGFITKGVALFVVCTELHAGSNPKIIVAASQFKKRSDRLFDVFIGLSVQP